jgi:thiopeptide-type bacteriocin biosynthesis protein
MTGGPNEIRKDFAASGFFVLRTPLLPFDTLTAWSEGLGAPAAVDDADRLEEALSTDRALLRQRLASAFAAPELREALFLASPDLEQSFSVWEKHPDSDRGRRLEAALVAYFTRAAARATPFGLFAGCSTGSVSERTALRLDDRTRYRRHSRLDMDYLWALAESLERDTTLRSTFCYRPNSSLYEGAGRLRFAEARRTDAGRTYHLVAVDTDHYLRAILDRARMGAELAELVDLLVDDEIGRDEAEEYLAELIDSQILVADLWPKVTGDSATADLASTLARAPETRPVARVLEDARAQLGTMDLEGLGVDRRRYEEVADMLRALPAQPTLSRLVQVDMSKSAERATVGSLVVAELVRGVELLQRWAPASEGDRLSAFRDAFTDRYEEREVPLVEALDEETGVGFERSTSPLAEGAPLLAGLPFRPAPQRDVRWSNREDLLLEKLAEALAGGRREIRLDPSDLARLPDTPRLPIPDAFYAMATVVADSDEAVNAGRFSVLLTSVGGPSGASLLGRFCPLDESLTHLVREHLRAEERVRPDCVFAEIVHLPEGRIGNILARPVLRNHEIPFLARSGVDPDHQIPITDLLVSVRGGRVVLRSRRLDKEVVPRLTTAHNFSWRSLGTYRFLCALQYQGVSGGSAWSWGPLRDAPFLPRVVSGRLVLSRAQWRLGEREVQLLTRPLDAAQFAAVQRWRGERGVPRYVSLADADNELVLDLDNVLSLTALAHQLRGRRGAVLVEMFPGPGELCVRGPEGRFVSEIVVPFVRSETAATSPRTSPSAVPGPRGRRAFPPGSSWLYLKLYGGAGTADRVLAQLRQPAIDVPLAAGAALRWFFIRYADPDPHLRLRWHGEPSRLHEEVLPAVLAATEELLDTGQLWRVAIDTYTREVERYGGYRGVELAEEIFAADSDAVLAIVCGSSGDAGHDLRWRLALAGMDRLLDDLGLSPSEQRAVVLRGREGFGREFRADGRFRGQVGARFRAEREALEQLLSDAAGRSDPDGDAASPLDMGLLALRRRSARIARASAELRELADRGELTVPLTDLAASLVHMHVNRSLRSAQRAHELVLYELLDRLYSSRAARASDRVEQS